jgi:FlaA1/EpsC-like NDP-sugar epimerase
MFYKNRNTPRSLILTIDTLLVFVSVLIAYLLRFNFNIPASEIALMPKAVALILSVRFLSFLLSKIFAGIIRYTETQDIIRVLFVVFLGSTLITIGTFVIYFYKELFIIPRAVLIIEFVTTTMSLIFFRLLVKVTYNELNNAGETAKRIGIFGAGEAGVIAKTALLREQGVKNKIIAFFDDNPDKSRKKIDGTSIVSGDKMQEFLKENPLDVMIIAVQNINPARKSQIADLCLGSGIDVKDIPPVNDWINGELSAKQIKGIKITDLLERDEIALNLDLIRQSYQNKRILITGAAGSIGSEIARQLIKFSPAKLILLDQAETPLHHLELELMQNQKVDMEFVIGDIRDKNRLQKIFELLHPQVVFHAAAYKHVPMMEKNPAEAIQTNVSGTMLLANLSVEHAISTFIMISSDKAVNPTNVMGASKRIAEMYIQSLNDPHINTKFVTTRFGNVLGSNGSVIPLFKKQIEERKPITITHPEITRYFMTIPEASQLVLEAGASGDKNEIYVFDMGKSVKIYDLARKMIQLYGLELGKDIQITFTGLRPGEKLYEELLATSENTIPTDNKKILKAKVRSIEKTKTQQEIDTLIDLSHQNDNQAIVTQMKKIVPEFKSKNSLYESLD